MGMYTDNTGQIFAVVQNGANFGDGTYGIKGPILNNNTNYHIVYYYQSRGVRLFVNNVEYTTAYGGGGAYMTQTAGETFYFGKAPFAGLFANNLVIDQALFYSSLSDADRATLYNNGSGTAAVPTTGLLREYDFEDDISNITTEGLGTGYNATLNDGLSLTNNGIIPLSSSPSEVTFFSSADGVTNGEKGIATWGDFNGRNQQQGKWFQWLQGNHYPLVSDNNGHWLFNPSNTSTTLPAVASTVDVAGNITIGSGYAGVNAAPANGLLVQGNVGIGTTSPGYSLDIVGGNASVTNNGNNPQYRVVDGTIITKLQSQTVGGTTGVVGTESGNDLAFITANATKMLIQNSTGNVAIGTTDPRGFKLAVNGSAIAESMTVLLHTAWPDYVFKPNYTLPSLTQVKSYIDKNQHLPEMPSEQEISEKGLNLGEMNKLLVKKVEELTLYLIEKDRQLGDQQNQLKAQQVQLDASKRSSEVQSAHIQRIEDELNVVLNKIKTAQ